MAGSTITPSSASLQPQIWDRLVSVFKAGRVGSAYLFAGPRGCAKEVTALEWTRLLNCDQAAEAPCGSCPPCRGFMALQHPSLKLILPLPARERSESDDPLRALSKEEYTYLTEAIGEKSRDPFYKIEVPHAKRIPINAIRELRHWLYLKSSRKRIKTVLILDAHLLTQGQGEPANALLKILEEPPAGTTLILVSDQKARLFPTIISRCQRIDFPPLSGEGVRAVLEWGGVETSRAAAISGLAQGDLHRARALAAQPHQDVVVNLEALVTTVTGEEGGKWRTFINTHSRMAAGRPEEFRFQLYLLQLWFHSAYRLRLGLDPDLELNGTTAGLEKFNRSYPQADLQGIVVALEEAQEAPARNLQLPLVLSNLLITINARLRGEEALVF